jgi:hypothetical protein
MRLEELELSAADETTSPEPAPGRFDYAKGAARFCLIELGLVQTG